MAVDKEMLKEFVAEVEDNLHELENNLLVLEHDSANRSLLDACFRNMHTIKGSSGYMGFTSMAKLAHAMEDMFDRVRRGDATIAEPGMALVFQGVDALKTLLNELEAQGEEMTDFSGLNARFEEFGRQPAILETAAQSLPDVDVEGTETMQAVKQKPDAVTENEEDEELFSIYKDELKGLLWQLSTLLQNDSAPGSEVIRIISDIERMTNYVGIDDLLDALQKHRDAISGLGDDISRSDLEKIYRDLLDLFRPLIGETEDVLMQTPESLPAFLEEDDQELYGIFLDFVAEKSVPFASMPNIADETWIAKCQESIEAIRSSAHYMDYMDVVALMDEWMERLTEALTACHSGACLVTSPLQNLWERLQQMLPGLTEKFEAMHSEQKEASIGSISELDDVLDGLFQDNMLDFGLKEMQPAQAASSSMEAIEAEKTKEEPFSGDVHSGAIDDAIFDNAFNDMFEAQPAETIQTHVAASKETTQTFSSDLSRPLTVKTPDTSGMRQQPEVTATATQTVRIDLSRVDQLLGDVGELVVLRAGMKQMSDQMRDIHRYLLSKGLLNRDLREFKDVMIRMSEQTSTMSRILNHLQDGIMKMRMLPIGQLFDRYPRMVRDLSQKLGKKVVLDISGADTTLDKRIIEQMVDPMMHLIRNCVDHGIEPPDIREKLGKPAVGTILLSASQEGNFVTITIMDDGKGLDRDALIQKAVSMGILSAEQTRGLPDERVWELVFLAGVSTASQISDTSGRGVGMDVVRRNVEKIGGQIQISSTHGKGTRFVIRIPLTLAIIQALLVKVGQQTFAVPLSVIKETLRVHSQEISSIEGMEMFSLRQQTVPFIRLSSIYRGTGALKEQGKFFVVMVQHGEFVAGLGVDALVGQQEIVIKPLAEYLTDQPGFAGATILGDGSIALILDIPSVMQRARQFTQLKQQVMEKNAIGLHEGYGGFMQ
ncbi:MAG: chemotaxis protein CheA [Dissulfuribacterales bacterium]